MLPWQIYEYKSIKWYYCIYITKDKYKFHQFLDSDWDYTERYSMNDFRLVTDEKEKEKARKKLFKWLENVRKEYENKRAIYNLTLE